MTETCKIYYLIPFGTDLIFHPKFFCCSAIWFMYQLNILENMTQGYGCKFFKLVKTWSDNFLQLSVTGHASNRTKQIWSNWRNQLVEYLVIQFHCLTPSKYLVIPEFEAHICIYSFTAKLFHFKTSVMGQRYLGTVF